MLNKQFMGFLDRLSRESGQKALCEAVKQGYKVCCEGVGIYPDKKLTIDEQMLLAQMRKYYKELIARGEISDYTNGGSPLFAGDNVRVLENLFEIYNSPEDLPNGFLKLYKKLGGKKQSILDATDSLKEDVNLPVDETPMSSSNDVTFLGENKKPFSYDDEFRGEARTGINVYRVKESAKKAGAKVTQCVTVGDTTDMVLEYPRTKPVNVVCDDVVTIFVKIKYGIASMLGYEISNFEVLDKVLQNIAKQV